MATSAARSEDTIPDGYPYSWSPSAKLSIEEFVAKYKPSMVQNDGTKPWLWVRRERNDETLSVENEVTAIAEAATFLQQATTRIEQIKNDASIPVRGNKKTGAKSKKEVREQVHAEAADGLKEISRKYGYVCGKWLIFAPSDKVDAVWGRIALSLASGPLSSTSAFCAKVATSPADAAPGYQHVICIYIPDVYNQEDVTAVMKVLLRQHGLNLSGVKSDLYTIIGLDSKHPSGIPSIVWKNVALLKDSEIKELKDAYYAELAASKATKTAPADSFRDSKTAAGKSKPPVKKKIVEDPFASDEDNDSKSRKLASTNKRKNQESETEESSSKSPVKKRTA